MAVILEPKTCVIEYLRSNKECKKKIVDEPRV